jgi:Ca2+-binding EF-hand superfamily protein
MHVKREATTNDTDYVEQAAQYLRYEQHVAERKRKNQGENSGSGLEDAASFVETFHSHEYMREQMLHILEQKHHATHGKGKKKELLMEERAKLKRWAAVFSANLGSNQIASLEIFKAALKEIGGPHKEIADSGAADKLFEFNSGAFKDGDGVEYRIFMVIASRVDDLHERFHQEWAMPGQDFITEEKFARQFFGEPPENVRLLFEDLDTNNDGKLSFCEFVELSISGAMLGKCHAYKDTFDKLVEDDNRELEKGHRHISKQELEKGLHLLKVYMLDVNESVKEMHAIWPDLEKDENGNISFKTYMQVLNDVSEMRNQEHADERTKWRMSSLESGNLETVRDELRRSKAGHTSVEPEIPKVAEQNNEDDAATSDIIPETVPSTQIDESGENTAATNANSAADSEGCTGKADTAADGSAAVGVNPVEDSVPESSI